MEEFIIPTSKDDLLDSNSKGYIVKTICNPSELAQKLKECREAMQNDGMHFILDHFDTLFSVLVHFTKLELTFSLKAWEIILKAYTNMVNELEHLLVKRELDSSVRVEALNITKMTNYIMIQVMRGFQDRPVKLIKSRSKSGENDEANWTERSNTALIAIYNCLQLPLCFLWDPPCCEDSFADLMGSACLTVLEDTNITLAKMKPIRETICEIFGTLVKHYNYGFSMIIRIGQMLNRYEHMVSPLVRCVVVLLQNYDCHSIVHEVIQEVARIDPDESDMSSSSGRTHAQFIVELAEAVPDDVAPHIRLLLPFLDMEPYTMRNAVLSVAGLVVQGSLTRENLPDESRKLRDELLGHLTEHIHDSNAFVRSKVLQIWRRLHEQQAIPISQQAKVLKRAVGRLKDKSSNVKKFAIQLVSAFLKQNPFAAKLGKEDMIKQLEAEQKVLQEMETNFVTSQVNEKVQLWLEMLPDLEDVLKKELQSDKDESDTSNSETSLEDADLVEQLDKVRKALEERDYLVAYQLICQVEQQLPREVQVLKPSVDAEGRVGYYVQLLKNIFITNIGPPDGQQTSDEDDKDVVDEKLESQRKVVEFLQDTLCFVEQLDVAVPAICELLHSLQASDVVEAVDFFTVAHQFGLAEAEQCISYLLTMVLTTHDKNVKTAVSDACKIAYLSSDGLEGRAYAEHVVQGLLNLLKKINIGQYAALEILISEWVVSGALHSNCIHVLWEMFVKPRSEAGGDDSYSVLVLLHMVADGKPDTVKSHVSQLVSEGLGPRGEKDFRLVSGTCHLLYKLAPQKPSKSTPPVRFPVDNEMFTKLVTILEGGFSNLDNPYYSSMVVDGINLIYHLSQQPEVLVQQLLDNLYKQIVNSESTAAQECDVRALSRLITIIGHVSLRHTMYLDVDVYTELKRRSNELKEKESASHKNRRKKNSSTLQKSSSSLSESSVNELQDTISGGTQGEDREAEAIRNVCELELLAENFLLGQLSSLVVSICSNTKEYKDEVLRRTAFLALSKIMLVSSTFCSEQMQLFITALSSSTDEMVRAHGLIAMADIAFRFPNVVEPWTPHMYNRLSDTSDRVRQTAVMIMTHLVMNDMVKVRSQISDLALCITDSNQNIANISMVFFRELSQKGNALYNALPDIISRLSSPQINLPEDKFRYIMKFILALIQKERHIEMVVEKVCQRFRTVTTDRQAVDLAYCLTLLQYSERAIRRLLDNLPCYSDKLHLQDVLSAFQSIIANATKVGKPEVKIVCEELEMLIEECLKKGVEDPDGEASMVAPKTPAPTRVRSSKTPAPRSTMKTPATRSTRGTRNSKTPSVSRSVRSTRSRRRLPSSPSSGSEVEE